MYREIEADKLKLHQSDMISWRREDRGEAVNEIIHVYPQPGDDIKKKKYFIVKDYEKVLFYDKAELVDVLGGGVYELNKKDKMKGLELVWIDMSFIKIQWGIAQTEGIPTKDGVFIGLHGDLNLRITAPKTFYNDVIAGRKVWIVEDLKNWIKSLMHTSLRDIFKNYIAKEVLLEDRERVINQITSKMTEELLRYGLELESINILGIKAPEGTEKLFGVEREKAKMEDEREILKAKEQLESEKRALEASKKDFERKQKILEAQSELEAAKYSTQTQKLKGETEAAVLEKTQEAKVAGDAKIIGVMGDKTAKIVEAETAKIKSEKEKKEFIKQNIEELKAKLNQFDDMLATDKISKDIYEMRVKRVEKELDELNRRLRE
jgi:regulator of protease activity HflC (stomatin/prohibitin superfamily)